jgi:integrase
VAGNYILGNETLSARTVKGIQVVIQMALEKAVAMRKLPENPNNVIDRIEYKRPKVKYLTSSQVADFLEKIQDEHWYAAFVTDLGTGLRISELVALKWQEHVDLERGK